MQIRMTATLFASSVVSELHNLVMYLRVKLWRTSLLWGTPQFYIGPVQATGNVSTLRAFLRRMTRMGLVEREPHVKNVSQHDRSLDVKPTKRGPAISPVLWMSFMQKVMAHPFYSGVPQIFAPKRFIVSAGLRSWFCACRSRKARPRHRSEQ